MRLPALTNDLQKLKFLKFLAEWNVSMYNDTQVQHSVDLITYKSQFSSQKCCETTLASWILINLCIKVFFLHMTARSRDSPSFHLLINKDSYFHEASAITDRTNTVTGSVQKGRSSKTVERPRAVLEVRKLWKISIHKSKVGLKVSTRLLKACEVYFICGHWAQMGKRILF